MRVVDRDALVHEREVVLLEAELAVLVQHEVDRLAVVLDGQLLELLQRPVEGVAVVELDGAVQRDRLRDGVEREAERERGEGAQAGAESAVHRGVLLERHPRVRSRARRGRMVRWSGHSTGLRVFCQREPHAALQQTRLVLVGPASAGRLSRRCRGLTAATAGARSSKPPPSGAPDDLPSSFRLVAALALAIAVGTARRPGARRAGARRRRRRFATTKVADNVYVFRAGGYQAMFVVTPEGVIATDPIGYANRTRRRRTSPRSARSRRRRSSTSSTATTTTTTSPAARRSRTPARRSSRIATRTGGSPRCSRPTSCCRT